LLGDSSDDGSPGTCGVGRNSDDGETDDDETDDDAIEGRSTLDIISDVLDCLCTNACILAQCEPTLCSVCQCDIDAGDQLDYLHGNCFTMMPCKHLIHQTCIDSWACYQAGTVACPLCRAELTNVAAMAAPSSPTPPSSPGTQSYGTAPSPSSEDSDGEYEPGDDVLGQESQRAMWA
jgi:hypothetical protein